MTAFFRTGLALLLATFTGAGFAQAPAPASTPSYEPTPFQEGKDVVWVPTPQELVDTMLDMAKVTAADFVMDLGSGDGRTVITAAKRGARAMGVEYNPDMVELSKRAAEKERVTARATFVKADLFETDFSSATVITMFLLPEINLKLRPKILGLKPGTRIVSNTFTMGDWKEDEKIELSSSKCGASWCTALLWIVPAKAEGTHRTALGELTLKQEFQLLSGTLRSEGKTIAVVGRVLGENVTINAGGREYRGRMNGSSLELAQAQGAAPAAYEPTSGQAGKDVVWVPTPQVLVDRMLSMAKVTPRDFVMDLGSGDGRTVITAAKRGARAMGVEYNPDMVELSKRAAEKEGVAGKATFVKADLFETDFSKASVITMFLLPDINLKLRPKILALKPGTRIVSNSFDMEDWKPDQTSNIPASEGCNASWCTAHLWIVPARVEGTHKLPQGELVLKQKFQMLSGTLTAEGKTVPVEGRVRGVFVTLKADGKQYRGKANGKSLELR